MISNSCSANGYKKNKKHKKSKKEKKMDKGDTTTPQL